jgi:hypothetical protein
MAEHTFTELDSLVDWEIVAGMSKEHGFWPPAGPSTSRFSSLSKDVAAIPDTVSMSSAVAAACCTAVVCLLIRSR